MVPDGCQRVREVCLFGSGYWVEEVVSYVGVGGHGQLLVKVSTLSGEGCFHAPSVLLIRFSRDESSVLEVAHRVGESASREERLFSEFAHPKDRTWCLGQVGEHVKVG